MTGLARDLWRDMVDKRLWPVAVLCLAAMAAAPIVLARGGGTAPAPVAPLPAPQAASAPAPAGGEARVVSLAEGPATTAPRGRYSDPFARALAEQKQAVGAAAQPPSVPVDGDGAPADAPTPEVAGGTATTPADPPAPAVPAPVESETAPVPAPDEDDGVFAGYRTTIHWGLAGSTERVADVTRLAPLHAGPDPLLVFLGTRDEGRRALFALARDALTVGDGRCLPAAGNCQVIELRAGQARFFDVTDATGAVTQYELDVDRIAERRADTRAWARSYRTRSSRTGRGLLADLAAAGQDYATVFDYVARDGSLVRDVPATVAWASGASE